MDQLFYFGKNLCHKDLLQKENRQNDFHHLNLKTLHLLCGQLVSNYTQFQLIYLFGHFVLFPLIYQNMYHLNDLDYLNKFRFYYIAQNLYYLDQLPLCNTFTYCNSIYKAKKREPKLPQKLKLFCYVYYDDTPSRPLTPKIRKQLLVRTSPIPPV